MRFLLLLSTISIIIFQANSANILAIFSFNGKSHYVMFERLILALAEKGHQIDLVTHFPPKKSVPNITNVIDLSGSLPQIVGNVRVETYQSLSFPELIKLVTVEAGLNTCETAFENPQVQALKSTTKKYDAIITELFGTDCMLGFGHYFKAPTVLLTSSIALPWSADRLGQPDNPAYIPNYFLDVPDRMTLWERVQNTVYLVLSKFLWKYYGSASNNRVAKEFFGADLPELEQLAANTSLVIVNSHLSISYARPKVPNFIEAGGLHIEHPKPLSEYLEGVIQTESKGIIYFSMGSLIMTETFPVYKLQGIFDAFAELPYKVLWKAHREKMPKELNIPDNIHFEPWMPQLDILCHKNVKLFVSHGGLMGSQEATYCGVPRLGIPIFGDQSTNIRAAERLGVAVKVDYDEISKETIRAAAETLLENASFSRNARRMSELFKDRPLSALDEAVYWVEYVMRHKGAPHLRSAGADLAWYQYYLADVGLALGALALSPLVVAWGLVKLAFRGSKKQKSE